MANRSYLYATATNPHRRKNQVPGTLTGLSEHDWKIPLSHKLLVSQSVRKCNSLIWEESGKIALIGDFKKGKEKLFNFLEELKSKRLFDEKLLNLKINGAKEFLSVDHMYTLLDAGEIHNLEISEEEPEETLEDRNHGLFLKITRPDIMITEFYTEVMALEEKCSVIKNALKDLKANNDFFGKLLFKLFSKKKVPLALQIKKFEKALKQVEQEKWNLLGINAWSNSLYHDLRT